MKTKVWIVAVLVGAIATLTNLPAFAQSRTTSSPIIAQTATLEEVKGLQNRVKELIDKGEYAAAIPLADQVLKTLKTNFPNNNREIAISLMHRGMLHEAQGKIEEAKSFYLEGLVILRVFKTNPLDWALPGEYDRLVEQNLILLAQLYDRQNKGKAAERLYIQAIRNFKKGIKSPFNPGERITIENQRIALNTQLIQFYARWGDVATVDFLLNGEASEYALRTVLVFDDSSSETETLIHKSFKQILAQTSATLSLALHSASNNPTSARLALTSLLRFKGRKLDIMADSVQIQCHQLNGELETHTLCEQWAKVAEQSSKLVFRGQQGSTSDDYVQKLQKLEETRRNLETEIRRKNWTQEWKKPELQNIQNQMAKDAALLEIMIYRPLKVQPKFRDWYEDWHYAAAVLPSKGEPKWVDLGKANEIDQSIARLRNALADKFAAQRGDVIEVQQAARLLDQQVMAKIRPLLGNAKHLLISADGELNLVPFEVLRDETGQYLIDRYQFSYLTSGRDLLGIAESRKNLQKPRQESVILADPDYGKAETSIAKGANERSIRSTSNVDTLSFNPLEGTRAEGQAIKTEILPDARLLMGEAATETALKQIKSPDLLLIATHGFFLTNTDKLTAPPSVESGVGVGAATEMSQQQVLKIENPLLRSGLALAGANQRNNKQRSADSDDGILTALEIAGLDLRGTQLVVLSACETGLGEAKVGDGVYGLRRALVIAGAQSQVLSLWKVDDEATKDLMVNYFRKMVKEDKGRHIALQESKKKMLKNPKYQHPYYWASFIPSGDWTPLSK